MRRRLAVIGLLVAACGGGSEETKEPITIALVAPKSGALGFVGQSFERVATTAVRKLNAEGGVNGHELVLIVKDDQTDATVAPTVVQQAIDEGAVAVVGPATSGALSACMTVAAENQVPLISPSSTAPSLATDTTDNGFVFRDVPNDNVQGLALAYYLTTPAPQGLGITSAYVVHEDTVYGAGLAASFQEAFESSGGTLSGTTTFTQNIPAAEIVGKMDEIEAANPDFVVLIALEGDAVALMDEWTTRTALAATEWFFTDGARSQGFLLNAPAEVIGMEGTAPTYPVTGDAYQELEDAYAAEEWGDNLADQVYAANVWDAVYLIAAALAYQEANNPDQPLGGAGLRDALLSVSRGPGQIFHAGQWGDLLNTVNSGGDIDYDGAAGPVDFDDAGEAIGPYEVWRLVDNAGTRSFEQVQYLDAQDLMNL